MMSQVGYGYILKRNAEKEQIVHWLLKMAHTGHNGELSAKLPLTGAGLGMSITPSNLEHAIIAAAIQIALFQIPFVKRITLWGTGGIAVAVFLGREIAQNEYWWAARYMGWSYGQPLNVPWYAGILSPHWHLDSIMDVICPVIACVLVAILYRYIGGRRR